jgi:hypothetical protein
MDGALRPDALLEANRDVMGRRADLNHLTSFSVSRITLRWSEMDPHAEFQLSRRIERYGRGARRGASDHSKGAGVGKA